MMLNILIANAVRYTGPDALRVLAAPDRKVFCHDLSFSDKSAREVFLGAHPYTTALCATTPEAAVSEMLTKVKTLDVLFCNHFQTPELKPLLTTDTEEFRATLEKLLVEPYRFIRSALPVLDKTKGGRIVIVSSAAGLRAGENATLYSAARAGQISMVKSLSRELGPAGIAVFGIAPNYFASDDTFPRAMFDRNEKFRATVERRVPLKRISNENEMSSLIRYLCLEDSAFVTGQVIAFTGGWL